MGIVFLWWIFNYKTWTFYANFLAKYTRISGIDGPKIFIDGAFFSINLKKLTLGNHIFNISQYFVAKLESSENFWKTKLSQAKSILKSMLMLIQLISAKYSELFSGPVLRYLRKKISCGIRFSHPNGQELNVIYQGKIFFLIWSVITDIPTRSK